MEDNKKTILVYAGWTDETPVLMGHLYTDSMRGKEIFSFEYDKEWLNSAENSFMFDPDLSLFQGRQYASQDKSLFGIFADSCPDRWGSVLMKRREAINARRESRKPKALTESDFLLGVYDESRMGALRFKLEKDDEFLASDKELAAPPWTTLRKLETASLGFESEGESLNEKWLNQLLAPGSSLGGARPKATVQDAAGNLWIAKFPSKHDEHNSGAWEKTVHDLAKKCNLNVPESKVETFSKNGGTFLVKRFDRIGKKRIHFASAMTLLGKTDGASSAEGVSYLDIASFIKANGAEPKTDLRELWKRIVFSMLVSNTDDHLRNHGFLLTPKGWRLSPMYDVNPDIYGEMLSLNVDESNSIIDVELAIETAKFYGLSIKEAKCIAEDMKMTVIENWESIAAEYGLSRDEREYMRPAFTEAYKKQ